jgi:hypothetical protein
MKWCGGRDDVENDHMKWRNSATRRGEQHGTTNAEAPTSRTKRLDPEPGIRKLYCYEEHRRIMVD